MSAVRSILNRRAVRLSPATYPFRTSGEVKSAVAEHSISLGHRIQLYYTAILSTKPRCMDRIIREATEIELHHNNMNRENDFWLSKSWKPLICTQKDRKEPPSHDSRSGFSEGPRRSVHTATIGHSQASTQMSRLPSATSAPSSPTACLRLTHLTSISYTSVPWQTHPYTFSLSFPKPANRPFSGRP
jgi:hypothetical protein